MGSRNDQDRQVQMRDGTAMQRFVVWGRERGVGESSREMVGRMISDHMQFVRVTAVRVMGHPLPSSGNDPHGLTQVGYVVLKEAALQFDPAQHGEVFSDYVEPLIQRAMEEAARKIFAITGTLKMPAQSDSGHVVPIVSSSLQSDVNRRLLPGANGTAIQRKGVSTSEVVTSVLKSEKKDKSAEKTDATKETQMKIAEPKKEETPEEAKERKYRTWAKREGVVASDMEMLRAALAEHFSPIVHHAAKAVSIGKLPLTRSILQKLGSQELKRALASYVPEEHGFFSLWARERIDKVLEAKRYEVEMAQVRKGN